VRNYNSLKATLISSFDAARKARNGAIIPAGQVNGGIKRVIRCSKGNDR
jgi:hypothetical protein